MSSGRPLCQLALLGASLSAPSALQLCTMVLLVFMLEPSSAPKLDYAALVLSLLIVLTEYICAIPGMVAYNDTLFRLGLLLPSADRDDGDGSPTASLYLLAAYLPALCLGLYINAVADRSFERLSLRKIRVAVMAGDVPTLTRAVLQAPQLIGVRSRSGRSLLHLAAEAGQTSVVEQLIKMGVCVGQQEQEEELQLGVEEKGEEAQVRTQTQADAGVAVAARSVWWEAEALIDVNEADIMGDTPAHLAARNGHEGTVLALMAAPGVLGDTVNSSGLTWSEELEQCGVLGRLRLRGGRVGREVAKWLPMTCLALLFVAGLSRLNLVHLGFLLLCLLFTVKPTWMRSYWPVLVAYAGSIVLALYTWPVFVREGDALRDSDWPSSVGFLDVDVDELWSEIAVYYVLYWLVCAQGKLFAAPGQMQQYRRRRRRHRRGSDAAPAPASAPASASSAHPDTGVLLLPVYRILTASLSLLTLAAVAIHGRVSLIKAGYLLLLLLGLLAARVSNKAMRRLWYVVTLYSATALFAQYSYQFGPTRSVIQAVLPNNDNFSYEDFGLFLVDGAGDDAWCVS